ncbi:class I SAM-dependent DNA methyltransferase, partial [Capnocytophaga gingivalis]|uniref:class I SAM-dependent DNA methyltransferase n=1 Tax=Capnocytophaga gingivalis TaxID=1017 RepID=UPI0036F29E0B
SEIDSFKANFKRLFTLIDDKESEEYNKNLISDFLKDTYYQQAYFMNTKERKDLVIRNGALPTDTAGVIIETKKFSNKSEMVSREQLNTKALQELVWYFLGERITHKNTEIKHLIITNVYEWFIFDAQVFERQFAQNKTLIKQYNDFINRTALDNKTEWFYKEIAQPTIEKVKEELHYTYFNLRDFQNIIENENAEDDNTLIPLYKILSPQHLLKLPFLNDSNTLDKGFYTELLHIIGLTETKNGGQIFIERLKEDERNEGTMLEETIAKLSSLNKIHHLKNATAYGETYEERLFNVALELNITWVNRILFLKLLEAQLISYHKGETSYAFLNFSKINEYDILERLFFEVLAKDYSLRNKEIASVYANIPYLNSSLFEPTELEHNALLISNLPDDKTIPILSTTVLKDAQGKRRIGDLPSLQYLLEFLDAYDFSSEGSVEIQEENKTLINASVLGLIFEKINGYKDGSFFTPGVITMYMCRESLHRAVIQKFNREKGWQINTFEELKDHINPFNKEEREEANNIINDLRICDPAVGSGHFLVSALNECIAMKSELGILQDENKNRIHHQLKIENDELLVYEADDNEHFFLYNPKNVESQRVQKTLFQEKKTIIENCLFGVDINPNSVKICRLRLWIELLKNAYYKTPTQLETLPNIDINIKSGNSLLSRFALDTDLKTTLKKTNISITDYKEAFHKYQNAQSKEQKWDLEHFIDKVKHDFRTEITRNSKEVKELQSLKYEYYLKYESPQLFTEARTPEQEKHKKQLEQNIQKKEDEIEAINSNKIYENAFEWRFEFPQVLDNEGNYIGFDVVIGNPPYIQLQNDGGKLAKLYEGQNFKTFARTGDIYCLFYEKAHQLLREGGICNFITSNKWMRAGYGEAIRKFLIEYTNPLILIDFTGIKIFETATVDVNILLYAKEKSTFNTLACIVKDKGLKELSLYISQHSLYTQFRNINNWVILSDIEQRIKAKIEAIGIPLKEWDISINYGIKTGFNDAFIINGEKRAELIAQDPKSAEIIRPILRGRDIKRYGYDWKDLYIIEARLVTDIPKNYPAVCKHLEQFKGKGKLGDNSTTKVFKRPWWAWMQEPVNYWGDFSKQKIVYPDISEKLNFQIVEGEIYFNNTIYFITSETENLDYLLKFLNSNLIDWYYKTLSVQLGEKAVRMFTIYVLNIPIPKNKDKDNIYESYQFTSVH